MSDINVGRVRPLFRGAYNAATTYNWWDVAKYDGTWWLYISTTSAAGITPAEGSTWTAFGTKGDTTVATDITGNAATATKASQDANGAVIADTYEKLANKNVTNGYMGLDSNAKALIANLPLLALLGFNTKVKLTASGTWTAPVSGWYKFKLKGGGGGGGNSPANAWKGGAGGASGAENIFYLYIDAGTSCAYTIGAGGAAQTIGGTTSIVINSTTYQAVGGYFGTSDSPGVRKISGSVPGSMGCGSDSQYYCFGGSGGGEGGAGGGYRADDALANTGGGGSGAGKANSTSETTGHAGASGYIEIEYNSLS